MDVQGLVGSSVMREFGRTGLCAGVRLGRTLAGKSRHPVYLGRFAVSSRSRFKPAYLARPATAWRGLEGRAGSNGHVASTAPQNGVASYDDTEL
jgi:hypothetical protein